MMRKETSRLSVRHDENMDKNHGVLSTIIHFAAAVLIDFVQKKIDRCKIKQDARVLTNTCLVSYWYHAVLGAYKWSRINPIAHRRQMDSRYSQSRQLAPMKKKFNRWYLFLRSRERACVCDSITVTRVGTYIISVLQIIGLQRGEFESDPRMFAPESASG